MHVKIFQYPGFEHIHTIGWVCYNNARVVEQNYE